MPASNEPNIHELLTAFTDGELDAAQNQRVLKHLQSHPQDLAALQQEQQLRIAARRAILQNAPAAPASLRERISRLSTSHIDQPDVIPVSKPFYTGWDARRWMLTTITACAASLALGVSLAYLFETRQEPSAKVAEIPTDVVSPTMVADVTRVHVDCSRMLSVHTGGYPQLLGSLADSVKHDLGRDQSYPDLSSVGYTFVGAGPCAKPLQQTVHLLYRSKALDVTDTLSVFVQPYTGQFKIEPGKAYRIGDENAPHPVVVWRTDKVIYFVIGDNQDVVDKACVSIGLAKL